MTLAPDIATDLVTPLGAYLRLRRRGRAAFLLESVERGRLGRHSLVGCGSHLCYLAEAEACGEPVVGYLAYDYAARLEQTVPLPDDGTGLPESRFVVADLLIRFDHVLGTAEVIRGDPDEVAALLAQPAPRFPTGTSGRRGFARRTPGRHDYEAGVRAAKEHIRAGDAFQIVLSQRAERPTSASALELYRALRRVNPSPYLFLLELDGLALIGSSPETLVKCEGRRAGVNPIAGTTERGDGDAERLLASEKDRAEHVMLVDLGRNDLSRVCVPGSVEVEKFLEVERYSHVTHLVSQVAGELRDNVSPFDLLRACFPAGTVSGAPKVRAMQLISELEGRRRGPYAGAVGYASAGRRSARHVHRDQDDRAPRRRRASAGRRGDRRRLRSQRRARGVPAEARRGRGGRRPRGGRAAVILLVDNYDSFTYNLAHLFGGLGADVIVRRNDAIDAAGAVRLAPSQLVISPGPGRPADAGATLEIIRRLAPGTPTLGICLGHQAIVEAFGGTITVARTLVHGKSCTVRHDGRGLFSGLPDELEVGRYHSLAATQIPQPLEISATATDGEVMAVRHRELPVDGLQFHPESVLTPLGVELARNFLER